MTHGLREWTPDESRPALLTTSHAYWTWRLARTPARPAVVLGAVAPDLPALVLGALAAGRGRRGADLLRRVFRLFGHPSG